MENAVDALHMGFAVFVFVVAITMAFTAFSQAKTVADTLLFYTDKTNFEEYIPGLTSSDRIVGLEAIIPAIRGYIHDNDGYRIELKTKKIGTIIFDILEQNEHGIISEEELQKYYKENMEAILQNYKYNTKIKFKEKYMEEAYSGGSVELADGETIEKVNTKTKVTVIYEEL